MDVAADPLRRLNAPLRARDVEPMLAITAAAPVRSSGWIHEAKLDGFRLRAALEGGRPRLLYRGGSDVTARFPEIAHALGQLQLQDLVLDGELVCHDRRGRPSFELLQRRATAGTRSVTPPVAFYAFDLLGAGVEDLRPLPLLERKQRLADVLRPSSALHLVDHVSGQPDDLLSAVQSLELEGIVSKHGAAPYRSGRSHDWKKWCIYSHDLFALVGLEQDLSAVHVAAQLAPGELRYAGRVEWGFRRALLADARAELERLQLSTPPCSAAPRRSVRWLQPVVRCRVRYKSWEPAGVLRQPYFLGFETSPAIASVPARE